MGIPLVALQSNTQQPSPLDQYSKAVQLKSLLQNQQFQQQQQPLELQKSQIQVQQAQQAQADQSATTKALQQWDGKDYTQLPSLVLKNGGSANAVFGATQHIVDLRTKASEMAKNDAATGASNTENQIKQADQRRGTIQSIIQQTDPSTKQAAWDQEITKEEQAGTIQPGSIPHQYPGDDAATGLANHLALGSVLAKEATEKLAAQARATSANTSAAEFKAKLPGGPLQAPEQAEMQDYLQKNPGAGPADYAKWKASLAPQAQINVAAAAGGGLSDTAKDQAAEKYWTTGQLPPAARGVAGLAQNRAIMNRAAELHPEGSLAANSAEYKANSSALSKVQTNFDQVNAFENTAIKNLDQVLQAGAKVPDLGVRFANVPVRQISSQLIGTPEMAQFKTALLTAQTEAAKVLGSANATGVLSDSARHEAQEVLDGNLPYPAMVASINQLKTDFANRHQSYQDQIADIKGRLGGGKQQEYTPASKPTHRYNPATGQIEAIQ